MSLKETVEKLNAAVAAKKDAPRHKDAVVDGSKTLAGGTPDAPAKVPYGTTGPVGRDSAGYSIAKAAAFASGVLDASDCKEELETSEKLKGIYGAFPFYNNGGKRMLIPFSTDAIPVTYDGQTSGVNPERLKFVNDLREKMAVGRENVDHDEIKHVRAKTLTVGVATDGGALRGFPTMGELVDLQRVNEIISKVGSTNINLGPNGLFYMPKLRSASTAYMVGETVSQTDSQQTTGQVRLSAKKMIISTPLTRESLKYITPSIEAMVRSDMAQVGARKVDQQCFYGTGSDTEVLGLNNYTTDSAWSEGDDDVILYTGAAAGTNGWYFQPEDVEGMSARLPDAVNESGLKFVMRKRLHAAIRNRRADAVTAADGAGQFVFDQLRSASDGGKTSTLGGYDVVKSDTILANRTKAGGSNLTSVWMGKWDDFVVGRFGVMEIEANPYTYWTTDITLLRGIQFFDAAARHAASLSVFHDVING